MCRMSTAKETGNSDRPRFREFRDAEGLRWKVWEVIPADSSARALGSIVVPEESMQSEVAETSRTMRATQDARRAQWTRGWLLFESGETRRRLRSIPEGWERRSEAQLAALCSEAKPA